MNINLPWKKQKPDEELTSLEGLLDRTLQPVNARPEFMMSLRGKLVGGVETQTSKINLASVQRALLILGAVVSGFFMILTGIRSILSLIGALGILRQYTQRKKEEQTASIQMTA
jgi:hypothetical protein